MRRAFRFGPGSDDVAAAVDDELAFHMEMRMRKLIDGGMTTDAARQLALQQFGDLRHVRLSCVTLDQDRERTMKRVRYFDELRQDVTFALRALGRNPAFAVIAVLTLALGIGANTAIFTLIDAVMLRTIPVHAPSELVAIGDPTQINWVSSGSAHTQIFSYPLYRDVVEQTHVLSGVAASGIAPQMDVQVDSVSTAEPEHPATRFVSANYFSVLGVPAARGRVFGPSEDGISPTSPVVVLSDQYWTRRFDRDPAIVGRTISVNDVKLTVIGVTPPGFEGEVVGTRYDFWLPISMQPALRPHDDLLTQRKVSWLLLLGRRNPGVSFETARLGLTLMLRQTLKDHAADPAEVAKVAKLPIMVSSGAQGFSQLRGNYRGPLFAMLVGVALLLLIICANIANLLLARAVARTPEFSVRLALGAGRGRLLRQLLTESAVLGALAAAVGLALAWAGSHTLLVLAADGRKAIPLELTLDASILAFTVAMSIGSVALFGLLPAFRSARLDLAANLRARGVTGALGARGQRFPIGTVMIMGQIALSLVLLMSAGLLVRNLRSLETTDVNVDRDHLFMLTLDLSSVGARGLAVHQLTEDLRLHLAHVPGVAAVTFSQNGLFNGSDVREGVTVPNWSGRSPDDSVSHADQVGPAYVTTIGGRLKAGRDLAPSDLAFNAAPVAIVNESFARFYFGRDNPLGRTFRTGDSVDVTIVGVIADVRDRALDDAPIRRFYVPFSADTGSGPPGEVNFAIRTAGDPARVADAVRRTARAQNAAITVEGAATLSSLMSRSITEQRVLARVASAFGTLALLLAAIGLYGVMTYAVTRRRGEIGLRIALGAEPGAMVGMVVRDAMWLVAGGTLIGVPLAIGASQLLRSQLHGVDPVDPVAVLVALAVLTGAAACAALVPAIRASRVSPLTALRQ